MVNNLWDSSIYLYSYTENHQLQTTTLFLFYKNIVFLAETEYSYISADFRLKIFFWIFLDYRNRTECNCNKCHTSPAAPPILPPTTVWTAARADSQSSSGQPWNSGRKWTTSPLPYGTTERIGGSICSSGHHTIQQLLSSKLTGKARCDG